MARDVQTRAVNWGGVNPASADGRSTLMGAGLVDSLLDEAPDSARFPRRLDIETNGFYF